MRSVKLKNLATIQNGYQERVNYDKYESQDMKIIKGKNINMTNEIDWENLDKIKINRDMKNYLIQKHDILFQARGENHKVIYINKEINNIIVGHTFFIIRVFDNSLLPEYLYIILNNRKMQKFISNISEGIVIPFVSKTKLSKVTIPIPDKKTQKTIIELYKLFNKRKKVMEKLIEKNDDLVNGIINNVLKRRIINERI